MAIRSVHCPVLGTHVTVIADLEGNVTRVICSEYSSTDGMCRLKKSAQENGLLSQLLERASEGALETRSPRCVVLAA